MIREALGLLLLLPVPQEDRETMRKVHAAVHGSFVGVEITLRKKTRIEKAEFEEEAPDNEAQRLQMLMENRQTLDSWGVVIEKGLILMPELTLDRVDVEKIEVTDAAGARFEAALHAVGRNHDFVLLKPAEPRDLAPLSFGEWRRPALGENFYVTWADRVDDRWHLNVSPYIQTNAPLLETKDWFCIDSMRLGSVVSDKTGAPVGVALDQFLWILADGRSSFLGKAIAADERVTDLEKKCEALRKALTPQVRRIEVTFRADKAEEFVRAEDPRQGRAVLFGIPVDDRGTLLVPQDLSREMVRKIEDIRVVDGARRLPGAFVGSFKSFSGMLVRADGLKTQPCVALDGAAPPIGQLFFTAGFEDRFGRSRVKIDYNRLFRRDKGLKGAVRLQPRKRAVPGAFLLDFDGRVVGWATSDKKEEDLDEMALEQARGRFMDRYRSHFTPDYLRRMIFFSEIAAALRDPASHFDAKAVPMSHKEEKTLVWLGIEFQELSKPLAEALGIQERDLTNDGRRGLLITELYPASPAALAGLRVEDILLSVQPEGEPAARDLAAEPDRFGGYMRGGMHGYGGRGLPAPWRPTRNYLTTMLTEIGVARKVTFEYVRDKAKAKMQVTLANAPTDYETAERFKDDGLGFTVKELTYEVRHYQKLDAALSGVVVAKVESGSRADVAKLPPLSTITRVNDVAVRDLAHFKELVGASKGLTLTTLSHGQTKLIELSRE